MFFISMEWVGVNQVEIKSHSVIMEVNEAVW